MSIDVVLYAGVGGAVTGIDGAAAGAGAQSVTTGKTSKDSKQVRIEF